MKPTDPSDISAAISSARAAFPAWSATPLDQRIQLLRALESHYRAEKEPIARAISAETNKPLWECRQEVDAMAGKIPISIEAWNDRCHELNRSLPEATGRMQFRPHGVLAVLGPFNMPGHLPNGHIVPAVLAGNTIVLKPSELTPKTGEIFTRAFAAAGFPTGVFNLVQGGKEVGGSLVAHLQTDGILFTGGSGSGLLIRQACAKQIPEKILALEMGGNNPLIVHQVADATAASYLIIQSAYITAGQRCSCARRLILIESEAERILATLIPMIQRIRFGLPSDDPEPFMGPVISEAAAESLLYYQQKLLEDGAVPLIKMELSARHPALLSPGLLGITPWLDAEFFGPLLQLVRVKDFDAAISEANKTMHGLSAGLVSDNPDLYKKFNREIRAGVLAWNRPMTGASSTLPFGGIGLSGNHRPSGYLAADYTAYPVASLEAPKPLLPEKLPPGLTL
jgi:succinylglutamic semialdehyde dehydrogenase